MNLLLPRVWNFAETALRLPSSKCPPLSHYCCRGVVACPPCKTTQELYVVRLKCRSLRSNLSSETAIAVLLKVKVQVEMSRVFFMVVISKSRMFVRHNLETRILNKLPCCNMLQRFRYQFPLTLLCSGWRCSLIFRQQQCGPQTLVPGLHSATDQPTATWIWNAMYELDSALSAVARRRVLYTRNRDTVLRRTWFFFSTESRGGLWTAQSRKWHSYSFSCTIHTAYIHTHIYLHVRTAFVCNPHAEPHDCHSPDVCRLAIWR